MTIRLSFHGAAGQVTGSMHLLEAAGARILLDAGLFQGRRQAAAKLNAELPFDARRIDLVCLSHAHIDHSGRLPLLVAQGFHGPIYATPATRDLTAIMLPDSAHIQEKDAEFLHRHKKQAVEPLYTMRDALAVQDLIVGVPYRRPINLRRHLSLEYHDAGHILGSASLDMRITEGGTHRLVFSGDIGRPGLPIIRDPMPPEGPVDTLIIESTYANRSHGTPADASKLLAETVRRAVSRGGKVLVPAFAVGRIQELVYALHELWRANEIPHIPVFIDSPLAVDATQVFRLHPEIFDHRESLIARDVPLFDFPLVRYVRDVKESKGIDQVNGPAIIIAASGMCESGRILHHFAQHLGDHRNIVLIVGFQAEHTLGRRLVEQQPVVRIFGEEVQRKAEVVVINGYSAHADREELRGWLRKLGGPVRRAFCVHGEADALTAMAGLLREEGVADVIIPEHGSSYEIG